MQEVSLNLTGDTGVGRFNINAKSTILLHDCDIQRLIVGKDVDKLKCIARGEPIQAKVHSTTITIPPTFLFITSNQKILDHKFEKPPQFKRTFDTMCKSDMQPTKRIKIADIHAVQNRYIECYVRERPTMPPGSLPKCGNFTRQHLVVGLFTQIIKILSKYTKDDFQSDYGYLYPISGLSKHLILMPIEKQPDLKVKIFNLMEKYEFSAEQIKICADDMRVIHIKIKKEQMEINQPMEPVDPVETVEQVELEETVEQVDFEKSLDLE